MTGKKVAHRPSKRALIVEAGVGLFVRQGYRDTTVAEIARASGVSTRAFYYHFESKEALLAEAVRPVADGMLRIVERLLDGQDDAPASWDERLARAVDEVIAWCDERPDEATLYYVWSRSGVPAVAAIRNDLLARTMALGPRSPAPARHRRPDDDRTQRARRAVRRLATTVTVETSDHVMAAVFAGDVAMAGTARHDIARSLAANNAALSVIRPGERVSASVEIGELRRSTAPEPTAAAASSAARPAHRPSRRDALIDAATAEFAVHRLDATVAAIARRARMAPNAVYYHVASKEQLFSEAVGRANALARDAVVPRTSPDRTQAAQLFDAWDRLSRWVIDAPSSAVLHLRASLGVSLEIETARRATRADIVDALSSWLQNSMQRDATAADVHVGAISLLAMFERAAKMLIDHGAALPEGARRYVPRALDAAVLETGLRIVRAARCLAPDEGSSGGG